MPARASLSLSSWQITARWSVLRLLSSIATENLPTWTGETSNICCLTCDLSNSVREPSGSVRVSSDPWKTMKGKVYEGMAFKPASVARRYSFATRARVAPCQHNGSAIHHRSSLQQPQKMHDSHEGGEQFSKTRKNVSSACHKWFTCIPQGLQLWVQMILCGGRSRQCGPNAAQKGCQWPTQQIIMSSVNSVQYSDWHPKVNLQKSRAAGTHRK